MFALKKGLAAPSLLSLLTLAGSASGQTTRTLSLSQGDTLTPASPFVDATSGTAESGEVTCRLTPDGRADVVSIVSSGPTVWEGRNKTRRAVGHGTVDYSTPAEDADTPVLYF